MKTELKNYFIPHKGNDYAPHSLQKVAMLGMVVLVFLSFAIANIQSLVWISSEWMVSTILPSVIVDLTNDERSDLSVRTLRRNVELDAAAQLKAEHMAQHQYFAHYSPDGISPWYWFRQIGYDFVHAGENLAIHFTDSDQVVDAWMNSPSHRANIVNGDFTEIGVGAAQGTYEGYQTVYVVQLFGTPAALRSASLPVPEPEPVVLARVSEAPPVSPQPTATAEPELAEELPQIAGSEDRIIEVNETQVSLSSERDPVVVNDTAEIEIAEVVTKDESIAIYSELVSTSTGAVPATMLPDASFNDPERTSPVFAIATKPQTVLQIMYVLIGLFVLGALLLSILIEIRRQHPVQIAYGTGLLAVMTLLYYVHMTVTSGALVV